MTWDSLRATTAACSKLSPSVKARCQRSLQILEEDLGRRFLIQKQPFSLTLINEAPWTRQWLACLGEALGRARLSRGYESLVRRLRDPRTSREALSVLEVADHFLRAGLAVTFDPTTRQRTVPDLLVESRDRREELYVEVSDQMSSDELTRASASSLQVLQAVTSGNQRVSYAVEMERPPSFDEQGPLLDRLRFARNSAVQSVTLEKVIVEGLICAAIAHPSREAALREWAQQQDLAPNELIGPPARLNDLDRLTSKVRRKVRQLPPSRSGIVVINGTSYLNASGVRFLPTLSAELDPWLRTYPNVLAVVVATTARDSTTHTRAVGSCVYATTMGWHFSGVQYHWITNSVYARAQPLAILLRLWAAFLRGDREEGTTNPRPGPLSDTTGSRCSRP